ncbi:staphylococcal nuclease domain-containing protein 1 isoform X1 [Nilaparvata lugens]|uniref:staphylococcal nuclease domain-containing protein 1 isoform X1 n=1 Tax=Nilaparvata lugens TaxID=108931 RepID=UPI000B9883A4|nr:staphylococcal nuclease domain-containing protein 1 isoform X1 [Nilaparvata lugens]
MSQPEPTVKQVMSGDSIIIRGRPSGKPPPETTLNFSNITAPKLAKRPPGNTGEESKDEPWAWEAREFLRKRLVGKRIGSDLTYVTEKVNEREYYVLYIGKDSSGECLNKLLVKEGLVSLRPSAPAAYKELEEQAKTAGKGRFSKNTPLVREVKWVPTPASMQQLVDHFQKKPIKTVIENVRDGSTVRCFVTMEDKTYHVTLLIAGIRCPGFRPDGEASDPPPFAHEAKYFVEIRLLQMDVEITLEAVQNNNIIGNIYHPKGNIAERLVEEGYAKCFDHTIQYTKNIEELRKLERQAKNKGLRLWKNWQPSGPTIADADKGFTGTVIEIINGDGMKVKLANGTTKKIFLSSIRPPRMPEGENKDGTAPPKKSIRPLYDIPWMFEAREFLRKKLIRKKVNVTVDYIQPARDDLPAKTCCTVMVGQTNVAEALVSKGLATVIKNRQDDDQRSCQWDKLNAAQNKAMKSLSGMHGKKEDFPVHRVNDHSVDSARAKAILPHIKRGNARIEGLVEYVASGSRLRLFLPKDSCLITLLLAGVTCPRAPRQTPGGTPGMNEDPFGQEALDFTREKVLQREVEFSIESLDKAGNFIGWLWYDNINLSVALVQEGLCKIHPFSAGKSLQDYHALMDAEKHAKDNRLNIWKDYKEEEETVQPQEEEVERKVNHQKVVVIEVADNLRIYVQQEEQTAKLEAMLEKMRKELQFALTGAYTPKKGDLCAAKFRGDQQWYRAKVEKVAGGKAKVFYVDYGNRDEVDTKDCATLPSGFDVDKPYAHEYALAYVKLVNDIDYQEQTLDALREDLLNGVFLMNVEYKISGFPHVTLVDPTTQTDMIKSLVEQGYLLIDKRREKRLQQVVQDYIAAEEKARKAHKVIWEHGDITEDDDREFGLPRK